MAATFRTRPWLLAPARSTLLSSFLVGAPRPLAPTAGQTRSYAKKLDFQIRSHKGQAMKINRSQASTSSMMNDMVSQMANNDPAEMAVLTPGTIVPLSMANLLSLFHKDPKLCCNYLWIVLKQRLRDRAAIMQYAIRAKGGMFKKYRHPQFKASRKGIAQQAAQLHATMSRCVAGGSKRDRAQLEKICTPKLYSSLLALMDSRPMGKVYKWERLALLGRPFWPRVLDHKWSEIPVGPNLIINSRQAVVAIKSRQRLSQVDGKGRPVKVPKEMELTEYLVLWRHVNMEAQTLGPWLISGTLKETSPADVQEEVATLTAIGKLRASEALDLQKKRMEQQGGPPAAGTS